MEQSCSHFLPFSLCLSPWPWPGSRLLDPYRGPSTQFKYLLAAVSWPSTQTNFEWERKTLASCSSIPRQAWGRDFPEFVMTDNLFSPPGWQEPGTRSKSRESGLENFSFDTFSARGYLIIPVTFKEKVTVSVVNDYLLAVSLTVLSSPFTFVCLFVLFFGLDFGFCFFEGWESWCASFCFTGG